MRRLLLRLLPYLQLARLTSALAAVANVWFIILWSRSVEQEPATAALRSMSLWMALGAGAVTALGLFAFGASLNDILDLRRDRAMRPQRPIAAGAMGMPAALAIVVGTLLLAIIGASPFGTPAVILTVLMAAAILVFNAAGKYIPGVGLVLLGLIYAGHMIVPNINLRFVWPVWLVMTHALGVAWVVYVLDAKVPRFSRRAMVGAIFGWVFWTSVLAFVAWRRRTDGDGAWPTWVDPQGAIWPALLVPLFALWSWRKARLAATPNRAAEKINRYGSLWLAFYASAWLLGQGKQDEGLILLSLAAFGIVAMTILRELYGLAEYPVGYRM